jgi:glucose/arabinose dehydrogenase
MRCLNLILMKQLFLISWFLLLTVLANAQTVPSGFTTSDVSSGSTWAAPVGTTFTSDGQRLFVWEKDGRVYVCNRQANGNYAKQSQAVIDIAHEVGGWRDFGLIGFALDPNFSSNGNIYLLYVVDRHHLRTGGLASNGYSTTTNEYFNATIGRVTRYTTTTTSGNLVAVASSRQILLGESMSTGIPILHESHGVGSLAFAADGTLLITAGDGASYNVVDEGNVSHTYYAQALTDGIIRPAENCGAFRSQMLNSHNGKLLRISPVTGDGISSNPFYDASAPRSAKSRVWAFGLRNPFRMSVKLGSGSTNPATGDIGEVFIGEVGWNTWEEQNVAKAPGVNFGWPLYEGHTEQSGYMALNTQNLDEPNAFGTCSGRTHYRFKDLLRQDNGAGNKSVYNPCNSSQLIGTHNRYIHARPILDWQHGVDVARVGKFDASGNATTPTIGSGASGVVGSPFRGNCSAGGIWYTGAGNSFPAEYKNTFIAADYGGNWVRRFSMDFTDVVTRVDNFVSSAGAVVCVTENPLDGSVVMVNISNNTVKKITYGGNQAPVAKLSSNMIFGSSPLTVNFTGNTSFDPTPGGSIASYSWNFGGGSPATSTAANPSGIVFTEASGNPRKFTVKLTVTDNGGATHTDSLIISVNNTPPIVNITSPEKNSTYTVGGDAVYNCTATVTDGQHSGSQLLYEWQTILRHNNHEHPEAIDNNVNTTTTISRIGCNGDTYYWMIKLKVTDAAGLSATDSSKIYPNCNTDNIPPTVTSVSPLSGATNVSIGTNVVANFSEPIDVATVSGTSVQLRNASNTLIPATVSASGSQVILTPSSSLAGSTVYTATITGGSPGVKDLAGNALASNYSWSFTTATVDNTAPTVTSVSPINGTSGVSIVTTVIANFSEAVNASTVTTTTFQLRDAGNNLVPATVSTSSGQITLTPSSVLSNSVVYTATITGGASGVKDLAGNALASNYSWSFTTATAGSQVPVTVQSFDAKSGAAATVHSLTGVPAGALLVLSTTSDAYLGDCIVSSTPALTWTKRSDAGASQSDNAEIWTALYSAGGSITVTSNWGSDFSQASVCFVVLNAEPVLGGASAIATLQASPSVTITTTRENSIVFGCTADWRNMNGATRTLRDGATERLYFRDGHYATYHYTKSAPTIAAYTLGVSAPTGQQASTALLEIRSAVPSGPDNTAPTVVSVVPINGTIGVSTTANIIANFSEAVNASTVTTTTFQLRDAGNNLVPASVNTSGGQATLDPTSALNGSTVYTATITGGASGVKDLAGNALAANYSWSFTTAAVDNTAPTVTSTTPVNGATAISTTANIIANFSESVNASTVTTTTFQLRDAGNNLIPAAVSTSGGQVTLDPTSALSGSTVYTATITGGASGVKDLAGNALAANYSWSFTTAAVDNTAPTVTSVSPLNGATGISISANIIANFSESVNAATVTTTTFQLRDAGNNLIPASVSTSGGQVTLDPTSALSGSTVYTATITGGASGVKDLAGNALASNYSWSFTTATVDNTPPTVTSVSPLNGATGVSTGTSVIANFSETVNASTVTTTTFQLRDAGNNLVPATVSTSSGQITLTPSSALINSALYTATITGGASGVKDLAGNALASNYSWSFTIIGNGSQVPVTIQSFNTKSGAAATVHSLTDVPAGALLVLATTSDAYPGDCIVTSTPALTWTKRSDAGASQSDNAEIWTALYSAGGSITVTSNWGSEFSQASVCYVVLNAEPVLGGASANATLQSSPLVTITTTRENSILFGCTADWRNINGATRTLRDAATERLYFRDGHYATYHYTKPAPAIGAYTLGVSAPTGQQASTALLEIRSIAVATRPANSLITRIAPTGTNVYSYSLGQNFPNPFVKVTSIPFTLSKAEKVSVVLFDINGREVKVLVNASKDSGKHIINFNSGLLSKGIYYYRMQAGDFREVKKLIIW